MIVKQWLYKEHRIILDLIKGSYHSAIFPPGSADEISYTPVVEMKHGQEKAEKTAEAFVDDRFEKKSPA
ncbi:MAG: hypothetical protein NVSMB6_24370 [Burkholderiaceae bacterium]